jgi:adenylate kinase
MNILFIGPQGSGKGTQARILCDKFGFSYFESGAYLRRMADEHPDIKKALDAGELVPDKEFTSYLTAYLDQEDLYDDIIFDGFPRTIGQYKFLENWLNEKEVKLNLVIVLQISEKETIRRLSARRQDPESGKIYNLLTEPPPASVDRSKLIIRDDDKPEAIKKRLTLYRQQTQALVAELRGETEVIEVNGERPIEVIAGELEEIVKEHQGQK